MKRILSTVLSVLILLSVTSAQFYASAFGGYAHALMAEFKGLEAGKSGTELLAYKSGCLLADIGKANWDDEYGIDSDEYEFTSAIYSISRSYTLNPRQFANGWRDHYIQDKKGSLANTNPPMSNHYIRYGWIDEYIRDELNYENPIQDSNLDELFIAYKLIRETCKEKYDGFSPTNSEIDTQIKHMFALYDSLILSNTYGWTTAQRTAIDNELLRTMNLTIGPVKGAVPNYSSKTSASVASVEVGETINIKEIVREEKLERASEYLCIEVIENISEDEKIVSIQKENEGAYIKLLNDYNSLLQ